MSDTHFILTGIIAIAALAITTPIVFHFTKSLTLVIVVGFVITETAFVILAMNREGFFLWAMVIFFIPLFHFGALSTLAHIGNSSSRPKQEHNINKVPKELRDVFQEQDD